MNREEYKQIKEKSGITVSDIWRAFSQLTPDQDKAYSSGRTQIPPKVANFLESQIADATARAETLKELLTEKLGGLGFTFQIDISNNNIFGYTTSGEKVLRFENKGMGAGTRHVYHASKISDKKSYNLILINGKNDWVLWYSSNLVPTRVSYRAYYSNPLETDLLVKALVIEKT
ncbi:hypothetical protein VrSk94_11950 [Vibrio rotiferianus]